MKKTFLLGALALLFLTSCPPPDDSIPVEGISITPETLTLRISETGQLTAEIQPAEAGNTDYGWRSENESVAKVDASGLVTAVAEGSAKITAVTAGESFTAACTVTVEPAAENDDSDDDSGDVGGNGETEPETIAVTGVSLNATYQSMEEGETFQLLATIAPENASNKTVVWSSAEPEAVSVDQEGLVTALQPRRTIDITVKTEDGEKTATCSISTNPSSTVIPAESLTLNYETLSLEVEETAQLNTTVLPENTTDTSVSWLSLSTDIVSVDENGLITGVSAGAATIYAFSATTGVEAHCLVTVQQTGTSETGISIQAEAAVVDGENLTIPVFIDGVQASYLLYNAATDDNTIAGCSVSYSGLSIFANSPGETEITVTTTDGADSAVCRVTVLPQPVTGISLDQTETSVLMGELFQLSAAIEPVNATNGAYSWSSSNPEVASVNGGWVNPRNEGSAIITATSEEGEFSASCIVTVSSIPATGILLSSESLTFFHGETIPIGVTFLPTNASNDIPVCTSDNEDSVGVSVDYQGRLSIFGRLPGSGTVTVTNAKNEVSAVCEVTVEPVEVTGIELGVSVLELQKGSSSTISVTILPSNASDQTLEWESSDEYVVWPNNGRPWAYHGGTAVVTARSVSNPEVAASCTVTVLAPVTGVSADGLLSLPLGSTGQPTVSVSPADASDKSVTYSIADPDIATVTIDGTVTALSEGKTDLTITTADGGLEAVCTVEAGTPDILPVNSWAESQSGGSSFGVPGDLIDISTVFYNGGSCRADGTEIGLAYYISEDSEVTTADTLLLESSVDIAIPTAETQTVIRTITVPALDFGVYHIGCIVDTENELPEKDEINNTTDSSATALFTLVEDEAPASSGAFKIVNSWGTGGWEHTADGHYWVDYESAKSLELELYYYHVNFDEVYEPSLLAVYQVSHPERGECRISFGLGDPADPFIEKHFQDITFSAGEVTANPFPNNKIALDITEFAAFINDYDLFMRVNNLDGEGGEVLSCSVEFYSDFDTAPFRTLSVSGGTFPAQTETLFTIETAGSLTAGEEESLERSVRAAYTALTLTEESPDPAELAVDKAAFGVYEEGKNYNAIVNGRGTGLVPPTEEEWASMVKLRTSSSSLMRGLIPNSVDNSNSIYFPPIGDQGQEGSCAAWSVGYYIQTYNEARRRGWDLSAVNWISNYPDSGEPDGEMDKIISPEFLYHLLNRGWDNGISTVGAVNFATRIGGATWNNAPYEAPASNSSGISNEVTSWPSETAFRNAGRYRGSEAMNAGTFNYQSAGYFQLKTDEDIKLLKTLLAAGYCVTTSVRAQTVVDPDNPDSWSGMYNEMNGFDTLRLYDRGPVNEDHANTIVGFKEGAAWDFENPEN